MRDAPENDRLARSRQARQVIAGSDVRPPAPGGYPTSGALAGDEGLFSPPQQKYLIAVAVLLALGLALTFAFSFGVASVIFFLLAVLLFAGWIMF